MTVIKCKKCGGRCFVDREPTEPKIIDLVCIICGKRRHLDVNIDYLGQKLHKLEKAYRLLGSLGG